jgi:hypothetical protein
VNLSQRSKEPLAVGADRIDTLFAQEQRQLTALVYEVPGRERVPAGLRAQFQPFTKISNVLCGAPLKFEFGVREMLMKGEDFALRFGIDLRGGVVVAGVISNHLGELARTEAQDRDDSLPQSAHRRLILSRSAVA